MARQECHKLQTRSAKPRHLWSYFYPSSPLPLVPIRSSDKTWDKLWRPLHWTPPNQRGHHFASNFSSRTTRIALPPPPFILDHYSIIPAPALSSSSPSFTFSLLPLQHAFIILYFHARSLGLHDGWSLFRGPPPCSIVAHHGCSWPRSLLLHDHERERDGTRGIV